VQGVRLARVIYQETGVGVKPTHAHVGMAGVVGTVTEPDAECTAVDAAWVPSHEVMVEWCRSGTVGTRQGDRSRMVSHLVCTCTQPSSICMGRARPGTSLVLVG
jgi:hypothetical protein